LAHPIACAAALAVQQTSQGDNLLANVRQQGEHLARGLACYAMPGTIDDRRGDHNMLAPPFIVTSADIDRIVDRFGDAVDAAFASLPSSLPAAK
jgi:adenosylmethionine-8-amino-7-oxononanoate aminotransferase